MPVDRGVLVQPVFDRDPDVLAFLEPEQRRRDRAVDRHRMARRPSTVKPVLCDDHADVLAAKRALGLGCHAMADGPRPGRMQAGRRRQCSAATEERPAVERNQTSHAVLRAANERKKLSLRGAALKQRPGRLVGVALVALMAAGRRRVRLGLALLVHALHLASGLLHLVAAVLAVMLALLVLAVVLLVLGMAEEHLQPGRSEPPRERQWRAQERRKSSSSFGLRKIELSSGRFHARRGGGVGQFGHEAMVEMRQRWPLG